MHTLLLFLQPFFKQHRFLLAYYDIVILAIIKIGVKNEVGFIGKRSLLHLTSKPTSFDFEAYFIFNNIYS